MDADCLRILEAVDWPVFVAARDDEGRIAWLRANDGFRALADGAFVGAGDDLPEWTASQSWPAGAAPEVFAFAASVAGPAVSFNLKEAGRSDRGEAMVIGTLSTTEADAMRDERELFLAMAAHDLRTPMRNVSILADELRDGFQDHGDGKLGIIDMLDRLGERASRLIAEVLSVSRVREFEADAAEAVDLGPLVRDIFHVLDPSGTHLLSVEDASLTVERATLHVVIRNLVDNAIKHGGRTPLRVRVTARPAATGCIFLEVADDGVGMSSEAQRYLEDGELTYGTGFGLVGLRRLITARGGRLFAQALPEGPGSRIVVELPGRVEASSPPASG